MSARSLSRRDLFADVGRGMFVASLGGALSADLGLAPAWAGDGPARLTFGDLEPLATFIRETPPEKIVPAAVDKLRSGTDLKQLIAAAGLANARAFGGEDYVGFHTLMALIPAYRMAAEETLPALKPLAVLKVLMRNATRLKEVGPSAEVLRPAPTASAAQGGGEALRAAARKADMAGTEAAFAASCSTPEDGLNTLMTLVDDGAEVHRVVLVSRAWEMLDFVGRERAHTMLRQSVHYCVKNEPHSAKYDAGLRATLPKVLDRHRLLGKPAGSRSADDAWVGAFADTIFAATPDQAADAVGAALAEGFDPVAIGEALSLAANQLVLRDEGRPKEWAQPNKPAGSTHGDSTGVHACDSVNAWRTLARVGDHRTRVTSLILCGYQIARDRSHRADFPRWAPYPRPEHQEAVRSVAPDALLRTLSGAIREKDQGRAAAVAARLAEQKVDPAEVFGVLRGFAISEDGALHAEKYYHTAREEFASSRPAFRWRQVVALARVTASAYGFPAPGYADACGILKAT